MKNIFQKLALALVATNALLPVGAMAAPALTNVQQLQTSVDATFNNTFVQNVSVSGTGAVGIAGGGVTSATGAGFGNTGVYTLTPNVAVPAIGANGSVIGGVNPTLGVVTSVAASMAATAGVSNVLRITPTSLAGDSVSVSTTVFGVENIRATQSVVESTTTTMF